MTTTDTAQWSVESRLKIMPPSAKTSYLKAVKGKGTPRNAIKAHCMECCGWQRDEIKNCTAPGCPLYQWRPFK